MQIQINTWQLQTGWFHPYMEDFFEYISLSVMGTADCEQNCMVEEIRARVSAKRRNKKRQILIMFTDHRGFVAFDLASVMATYTGVDYVFCFFLNVD